jgi:pimeloyl-ACP methyl ester carboxylesterase
MSALVYEEAADCKHALPPAEGKALMQATLAGNGWKRDDAVPGLPKCDDDVGTFFRVWSKEHLDHVEVVMVFRGTKGGLQDWIDGNLRWLTRILPGDDQYDRSRQYARQVLDHYERGAGRPGKPVRFYSAGHSLGGGLAQNALYSFPKSFEQAYAFDPSPVTGFADNDTAGRRSSCECREETLGAEARPSPTRAPNRWVGANPGGRAVPMAPGAAAPMSIVSNCGPAAASPTIWMPALDDAVRHGLSMRSSHHSHTLSFGRITRWTHC